MSHLGKTYRTCMGVWHMNQSQKTKQKKKKKKKKKTHTPPEPAKRLLQLPDGRRTPSKCVGGALTTKKFKLSTSGRRSQADAKSRQGPAGSAKKLQPERKDVGGDSGDHPGTQKLKIGHIGTRGR